MLSYVWLFVDCSPPGSSVHGILRARILEWIAIPFSGRSSRPRDQTQVSYVAGRFFTFWVTGKASYKISFIKALIPFMMALSSWPNLTFQWPHLLIPSPLGVMISTHECWGRYNIQTIAAKGNSEKDLALWLWYDDYDAV